MKKIFRKKRNKSTEDQRLALLAKELGVATMTVLVNDYDFTPEEADIVLGKVITQAKETRQMIVTNAVVGAYDILSKSNET